MKTVIEFLKNNKQVSARKMNDDLKIPQGSVKLDKGIVPKKYLQQIKDYLVKYGYNKDLVVSVNHETTGDVITSNTNREAVQDNQKHLNDVLSINLHFGNVIGFNKQDKIARFRDMISGLWRRYNTKLDKDNNPISGWETNGEVIGEEINQHFITKNNIKVFLFN